MGYEYDIPLGGVHVGIFQQEDTVYTVLLEQRELDKETDRTSQILANDQVLLSPHLHRKEFIQLGDDAVVGIDVMWSDSRLRGESTDPYASCP